MGDESKMHPHIHPIGNGFPLGLTELDPGVNDAEE